ncbi:MAG: GDSL-type esterase/lipase family protein [Acidobacteriota bacterium]
MTRALFRRQLASLLIVIALLTPWGAVSAVQSVSQDSSRLAGRRNIGRVLDKLRAGKAVTIAYLGGSITAGAGASDPSKTSYRALLTESMRTRYPHSRITEINAAVIGTGSLYASMRARRDVIAHKPDLVFVEFAVYDAAEKEDVAKRAMEGIVRQLLTVSQPPEIVFVYATNPARAARVEWHEAVARYYRLPSVNLQDQVWSMFDAGAAVQASFWTNGLNTSDEGHRVFAKLIGDFILDQEKQTSSELVKSLQPPFLSDELTYGELIPVAQLKHEATWRNEPVADRALPSHLLVSDKAGTQFETVFEGTVAGLAYRMGPDGGSMECLIDGKPAPAPLAKIDTYDATHHIAASIISGLGPGEHRLTVRLIADKNVKSVGTQIRLGYLLVGGQRPERL